MTVALHPAAMERCVPADPREAVRDRYRTLATQDRPGDPLAVPFDPRPSFRRTLGGSVVIGLSGLLVFCALVWALAGAMS